LPANVVNCDMLPDTGNRPEVHQGRLLLSRPYQISGVALGLSGSAGAGDYRDLRPMQ
jgi:hypothetical protein